MSQQFTVFKVRCFVSDKINLTEDIIIEQWNENLEKYQDAIKDIAHQYGFVVDVEN